MSREIKFRAWIKKEKLMINVDEIDFSDREIITEYGDEYKLKNCELMQFTGLIDKNGKDIYEGDVFKVSGDGVIVVVEWDEENARFLGFTVGRERKIVYVGRVPAVEVIGNVHENTELLEREDDNG